ncbi:glycosyltransferase family 2 protein [Candidatus Uhrbacteria bacterium]|nr:glycosyltransferase family 2 protein [Candidatus Uhrbacteria bacterium]
MDLSVVIVNWKVRELVRRLLDSIKQHTAGIEYEVFVVDNDSRDGSVEMIRSEFPWVKVIANTQNLGFAKACNQGIRESRGEFILLLNPDMLLVPNTLSGMLAYMRRPENARVGIAGCHLIDEQGKTVPHVRRFPHFSDQLAILLKLPHVFPRVLDRYLMNNFDYEKEARVDSIRGSFFLIRRAVIEKIGPLDEGFFIWFEEVDFCKRARAAAFEVAYTPSAQCIDYIGQSFKQVRLYSKQKMLTRSMLYYFKKHAPTWQWFVLWCVRPIALGAVWAADRLRVRAKRVT